MYILISDSGSLSLQEADKLGGFSIVEKSPGAAAKALVTIAEAAGEGHFWIDANAVIELSPLKRDGRWVEAFWEMLRKAEPFGYSDLAGRRIKAHVEQDK